MTKDKLLILGIIKEIEEIQSFCTKEHCNHVSVFLSNSMLKKSVVMSLINVSEFIKELSDEFKHENTVIKWNAFKHVRNVAAHKYGEIDFTLIWSLVNYCNKLLTEMKKLVYNVN